MKKFLILLLAFLAYAQIGFGQTLYKDIEQNAVAGGASSETIVTSSVQLDTAINVANRATDTTYDLKIDGTLSISASKTLPANTRLRFTDTGVLCIAAGQILTIVNGAGLEASRDKQIFSCAGNVRFSDTFPETVYPEWWGRDVLTSVNKIITSYTPVDPAKAIHIVFANNKIYQFSDTWEIDAPVLVESQGGSGFSSSVLQFPTNKTGIITHASATKTGVDNGRDAGISVFKNIRLQSATGVDNITPTNTVNVSDYIVTKVTGGDFLEAEGVRDGTTITIGAFNYIIEKYISPTQVQIKPVSVPIHVTNGSPNLGKQNYAIFPTNGEWDGRPIIIDGVNYKIQGIVNNNIVLTTKYAGASAPTMGYIQGISAARINARVNLFHGFDLRSPTRIEDCSVFYFSGNGLSYGGSSLQGRSGTTPNTNNSAALYNKIYTNAGSGIYTRGLNQNQMYIANNDLTDNRGYGIYEHSFLGNNYVGNHTSFNYAGSRDVTKNGVNFSLWFGEYDEGGQPGMSLGLNNLVVGGNPGAGFAPDNQAVYLRGSNSRLVSENLQVAIGFAGGNTKAWGVYLGGINNANVLVGFGAGEEEANIFAGFPREQVGYPAYQLNYNQHAAGWYGLGFKTDALGTPGIPLMMMSGSNAPQGGGLLALPTGFRTGLDDPQINRMIKGVVSINPASIAANSVSSQTFTLTGVEVGDSLTLNPPAAGLTAGLLVNQSYVSAANQITVVFFNATGSAIDAASANWNYMFVR